MSKRGKSASCGDLTNLLIHIRRSGRRFEPECMSRLYEVIGMWVDRDDYALARTRIALTLAPPLSPTFLFAAIYNSKTSSSSYPQQLLCSDVSISSPGAFSSRWPQVNSHPSNLVCAGIQPAARSTLFPSFVAPRLRRLLPTYNPQNKQYQNPVFRIKVEAIWIICEGCIY